MQRRSLLKGIFAAGVAPLFIPNLKVWTPPAAVVTLRQLEVDAALAEWQRHLNNLMQSHLRNNLNVVYGKDGAKLQQSSLYGEHVSRYVWSRRHNQGI